MRPVMSRIKGRTALKEAALSFLRDKPGKRRPCLHEQPFDVRRTEPAEYFPDILSYIV